MTVDDDDATGHPTYKRIQEYIEVKSVSIPAEVGAQVNDPNLSNQEEV